MNQEGTLTRLQSTVFEFDLKYDDKGVVTADIAVIKKTGGSDKDIRLIQNMKKALGKCLDADAARRPPDAQDPRQGRVGTRE